MKKAYIIGDNIISSLGFSTSEVIENLRKSRSGISICHDQSIYPEPFQASIIDKEKSRVEIEQNIENFESFTYLEQLYICSIKDALSTAKIDVQSSRTLFIFSTTKGNIDLLAKGHKSEVDRRRTYLHVMAQAVSRHFGNDVKPIVVSNACISGVLAINIAKDLIENAKYDNVVVSGGDLATEFTISGFQSFKAISEKPCRPYDSERDGITIGEACATIILSNSADTKNKIQVAGGGSSNDANHISGPSRTGDGLMYAVEKSIAESHVSKEDLDYISAHGTATVYNDEMESKAFNLVGVQRSALNSLKGYWGHTLGAAGVIEMIAAVSSMKNNELYKSIGYESPGTSGKLNVIDAYEKRNVDIVLKTASGFGGCNAATILIKE